MFDLFKAFVSFESSHKTIFFLTCATSYKLPSNLSTIVESMVLTLDGNLETDAHKRSDVGCLICLRHLFCSRTVVNPFFSSYVRNII